MGLDKFLKQALADNTQRVNQCIMTGGWGEAVNYGHEYLDKNIRNSFSNLTRLKYRISYDGYQPATIEEELAYLYNGGTTKKRKQQDIGKITMSLYKFMFTVDDTTLVRYLYLPYCKYNSSLVEISGNTYHLIPVMTYNIISPKHNEVFIKLNKCKLIYKSVNYTFLFNGEKRFIDMIYVDTKKNDLAKPTEIMKVKQIAALQIICGYGIKEAFRKYLNLVYGEDFLIVTKEKLYSKEYVIDFDKYNVIESMYEKNSKSDAGCVVLVRKDVSLTPSYLNYLVSIIYTLEHFHARINSLLSCIENNDVQKEVTIWRTLFIIFSYKGDKDYATAASSAPKLFESQIPTFVTIEEASELTRISKEFVPNYSQDIKNFYDLCHYLLNSYTIYINTFRDYNNNIDNKKLDILYYLYYPLIQLFNKVVDKCNSNDFGKTGDLAKQFDRELTNNRLIINSLNSAFSSTKLPLAVSPMDNTLDNKYLKITASIEDQNNGDGIHKKKKPSKVMPGDFTINPMDMLTGSILYLNKKKNSAKYKANIFLNLNGLDIIISDAEKAKIDKIKNMLVLTNRVNNDLDDEMDDIEIDRETISDIELDDDIEEVAED